jgi:hypothetical protein
VKVLICETNLLEIADTRRPSRRLARALHRRQQQADEHRDDRDDDEQFDKREALSRTTTLSRMNGDARRNHATTIPTTKRMPT